MDITREHLGSVKQRLLDMHERYPNCAFFANPDVRGTPHFDWMDYFATKETYKDLVKYGQVDELDVVIPVTWSEEPKPEQMVSGNLYILAGRSKDAVVEREAAKR